MLRNRFYYAVKPLVPARMRRFVRSWVTQRKRARVKHVWPIMPGSQAPPPGWPGWPDGRRFAFVLTHDVEELYGLAKCRRLMEFEKKLGFRSSFNLIPEGPYQVPRELREELTANSFEVGVHDLHHDGKLYESHRAFVKSAERINQYLQEWGAVGFRSGFMLHNLEWAHQLNILYEASTFDTDPFEPQPEGLPTIFPHWISRPVSGNHHPPARDGSHGDNDRNGYLELPYTLAQDSTLFLLLGEESPDIWFEKVRWVAKHGGMVLVDTHPDYMCFPGEKKKYWEYPVELYEALLQYVASEYRGQYWHALPKEVANYWHEVMPLA
jgi:hypothetical protein